MPRKRQARSSAGAVTPLPKIDMRMADAIQEFLETSFEIKRPPELSAKLLALIVELHRAGRPFPPRAQIAKELNCSVFGIDAAIAAALRREVLQVKIAVVDGSYDRRPTINQLKSYVPCSELMQAARVRNSKAAA